MNTEEIVHPAVTYVEQHGFDSLMVELQKRIDAGHLTRRDADANGELAGLSTFCYSKTCPIDRAWDEFTTMCRGLILDMVGKKIVATPFPKFFNYLENGTVPPKDVGFQCLEKLDGSLIITFMWNGKLRCATKGSFQSDQAVWALDWINTQPALKSFLERLPGFTMLFEAIYVANQIVVKYDYEGLVLLGGYRADGSELDRTRLEFFAADTGVRLAGVHHFDSVEALREASESFGSDMEGYVVRFDNGLRLKIKGAEYCRVHRLVSRLTPLSVWENMLHMTDMAAIRVELPEEFWCDFDSMLEIFQGKLDAITSRVAAVVEQCKEMSNKDVGLSQNTLDPVGRKFVFAARQDANWVTNSKHRRPLFDLIRPTANVLEGYVPSVRFKNVESESG